MRKQLPDADSVAVLDKAVDLLECLADGGDRSVAELAEAAKISKAAAYRILHTLERRGFVVTYGRVRRYRIGYALLAYREAARHSDRLLLAALPAMRELWKQSDETVNLGIRSRGQVLYIEVLESTRSLRATGQAGSLDALHSTALGKAMLSRLPVGDLRSAISQADLEPRTEHTVTDRRLLLRAIQKVREVGFAIDDQENEIGMRCVAAPIVNPAGWPLAALSVSGPTSRMTPQVVEALGPKLRESCAGVAETLISAGNERGRKPDRAVRG
jgi:IclR family acetate operon transcriptional repressor